MRKVSVNKNFPVFLIKRQVVDLFIIAISLKFFFASAY